MKKSSLIIFFLASFSWSQNTITKTLTSNATTINIELEQADAINIVHNTEGIIAVKMNTYPFSKYLLTIEEKNNEIFILSKKIEVENLKEINKICKEQPFYPSFEISIPKQKNIYLHYKKGNFYTSNFYGNITLEAENSNVHINGFKGKSNITVLAGFIECALSNSIINIENSKARITTTFDKKNTVFLKKLQMDYQKPINSLKIKTIYANVLLKTFKTQ